MPATCRFYRLVPLNNSNKLNTAIGTLKETEDLRATSLAFILGVRGGTPHTVLIDTELERIHTDAVDVRGSLDTLQEDSKLKPPTFANVSNKQVIIGAASAGAVVGGAIGVISNLTSGGGAAVDGEPAKEPRRSTRRTRMMR